MASELGLGHWAEQLECSECEAIGEYVDVVGTIEDVELPEDGLLDGIHVEPYDAPDLFDILGQAVEDVKDLPVGVLVEDGHVGITVTVYR